MKILTKYRNGNADIKLYKDGTRIIQFKDTIQLDYPLNIDIRVNTACPFGLNKITGKTICKFCHESATLYGKECNYDELKSKLSDLPKGIELAIGGNNLTLGLLDFLIWAKNYGFVCNLTVNQLLIKGKNDKMLKSWMENEIINGLGISYRKNYPINSIDDYYINHPNVVLHVITGIDNVDDVISKPFRKVLVLGYKKFGFGIDYYNKNIDKNIQKWYWWIKKLIDVKDVVSFDNLALEQLNIKRFLTDEKWNEFNQEEHSMYISAVEEYFAPSSRSDNKTSWNNASIKEYFKMLEK